ADWLIAFWHHPPYTKGSHDSDVEGQLIEMRKHIMPIMESAGVDLVLTGHSHIYERSMLMDGAYDTPTVAKGFILDDKDGDPKGEGSYKKSPGLNPHEGTIQVVAGHGGTGLMRRGTMPIMKRVLLEHGSLIVEIKGDRMDAIMLNKKGVVSDRFSIDKSKKVTVKRLAKPRELAPFVNLNWLSASATMDDTLTKKKSGVLTTVVPAIHLKGIKASISWDTKNTSWSIEPKTVAIPELESGKKTTNTFKASFKRVPFPLPKLKITLTDKDGKKYSIGAGLHVPAYRSIVIKRMKTAPVLDGTLAKNEIGGLDKQSDLVTYGGTGLAVRQTQFYLGYFKDFIYIGIENFDPNSMNLKTPKRKFDDGMMWADDSNEIFFHRKDSKDFLQLAINANGNLFDVSLGGPKGPAWNSNAKVISKRYKDKWITECFLPFSMFAKPLAAGDKFRFNLLRTSLKPEKEMSQWSHTNRISNHAKEFFGFATMGK
ncbi:MAG: metallophosphoesterase, partial [Lentisphaeria bacterium]|nr:metallophosphoesterase [Lentisphaeria bacterium]